MIFRCISFVIGTMLLALGIVMAVKNPWGAAPWDVLHLAVAQHTGLTLGVASIATSLFILLITLACGGGWSIRWGTLFNTVLAGIFIDVYIRLGIPDATGFVQGVLYLLIGVFCLALGSVLYTRTGFGAGARDGLTLVLSQRLPYTVGVIRLALDATAAFTGWALGGAIGLGTLIIVLGTGPTTNLLFRFIGRGQLPATVRIPERA